MPKGIAKRQKKIIEFEKENAKIQSADKIVLKVVSFAVPNLFISFAEKKLDITVPNEIKKVIKFA